MNGAPEQRAPSPDGSRSFFDGRAGKAIDVPLYRRERMGAGVRVPGPAIIAEDETSTFVTASFDARIDAAGCIVMERTARRPREAVTRARHPAAHGGERSDMTDATISSTCRSCGTG